MNGETNGKEGFWWKDGQEHQEDSDRPCRRYEMLDAVAGALDKYAQVSLEYITLSKERETIREEVKNARAERNESREQANNAAAMQQHLTSQKQELGVENRSLRSKLRQHEEGCFKILRKLPDKLIAYNVPEVDPQVWSCEDPQEFEKHVKIYEDMKRKEQLSDYAVYIRREQLDCEIKKHLEIEKALRKQILERQSKIREVGDTLEKKFDEVADLKEKTELMAETIEELTENIQALQEGSSDGSQDQSQ